MLAQQSEMTFENFRMETRTIIDELGTCHNNKRRQIDRIFDILSDNVPSELKDEPINETFEQLLSAIRKKLYDITVETAGDETNQHDIIDESIFNNHEKYLFRLIQYELSTFLNII